GTSADIAVVEDGRPRSSTSEHIGGIPVMMPVVGVTAIGAGGGSVAWVDDVGVPKVGPQSMGAHPGPACYGRGGKEATLTDAFLVGGFLDAERFLGGRMPLDRTLADDAIARFADRLGMAPNEAADMRYAGQSYEIEVPVELAWLVPGGEATLLAAFHRAHERVYGHADRNAPAEIVNLRVQLRAARPRVPLGEIPPSAEPSAPR